MRSFLLGFSHFSDFFHSFQGVFFDLDFLKIEKYPLKTVKKVTKMGKTWTKRPHPINVQCITRIYRYVGARMMHFNKNESKIKILKIPIVWVKISKTSILDHIYIYMALIYLMRPWTSTNAENFQTSRVNYILIIGKNDPTQHIYVKFVYSTPQF